MAMNIMLEAPSQDGIFHLAAKGDFTGGETPGAAGQLLSGLVGQEWSSRKILLDFGLVTYIDSSAIGWLIATQRQCRQGGGRLVLHSVVPAVQQVFDILRVGKVIPLVAERGAGVAMLAGAS